MPIYRPTTHRVRTASVATLAVLILIFAYGFVASAWLAGRLGYVPALGRPLFGHIYSPFSWIAWSFHYYRADPSAFAHVYWLFIVLAAVSVAGAVIALGLTTRKLPTYTDVQGSARFMETTDEVRKAGLLPRVGHEDKAKGVLLGFWPETVGLIAKRQAYRYLRHAQIEHIQLFGPPGSGKGVAFVYNAINTWESSMVILDRKGSLHTMTSGYLAQAGYRVLRWAPLEPDNTIGINILDTIRDDTHEIGDAMNFAKALIPPELNSQNRYFTDAASRLLASAVLYVILKARNVEKRKATLADLVAVFGSATDTTTALYKAMHENQVGKNGTRHAWISDMGSIALKGAKSERTDANIFETAFQKLFAATDPMVQLATSDSHFQLDELMNGDQKIALFLVLPPSESDLQRLSGIFTTILSMMIEIPTRKPIRPEAGKTKIPHKRPLMMLLDEIGNVGRINSLPGALTQLREYGVKIIGIWQTLNQITEHYGRNNPLLGASEIQMSFAPNDMETAEWLSNRLGDTTAVVQNIQMSGHRFGWGAHNFNTSNDARGRKLMTPEETMRLPGPTKDENDMITAPGEILIMKRGEHAIRATQALWWTIPALKARASIPPIDGADSAAQPGARLAARAVSPAATTDAASPRVVLQERPATGGAPAPAPAGSTPADAAAPRLMPVPAAAPVAADQSYKAPTGPARRVVMQTRPTPDTTPA